MDEYLADRLVTSARAHTRECVCACKNWGKRKWPDECQACGLFFLSFFFPSLNLGFTTVQGVETVCSCCLEDVSFTMKSLL